MVDLSDDANPMHLLGRLLQNDFVLMEKRGAEHVLSAAVLCFPASWRLREKAGQPLTNIHVPVAEYDNDLARRVQRLFDGIQVGRPLWRFNQLWYDDPELFQPRSALEPRRVTGGSARGPIIEASGKRCCACRKAARSCLQSTPMCWLVPTFDRSDCNQTV